MAFWNYSEERILRKTFVTPLKMELLVEGSRLDIPDCTVITKVTGLYSVEY